MSNNIAFSFTVVPNNGKSLGDEEPYKGFWAYLRGEYIRMMADGGMLLWC